eukprot:CAMPEP_0195053844 /NCGR_PEP_ID=MMETSP0448-20130528/2874_1 /TAXON_ID=66468 /ORGANISM="Heterocapsa triquestra, Strain CCMP 448" /LENGTH=31 /DNA_ID= /DNA_START= /DNA_END= /DNA_ORIENTATION=
MAAMAEHGALPRDAPGCHHCATGVRGPPACA